MNARGQFTRSTGDALAEARITKMRLLPAAFSLALPGLIVIVALIDDPVKADALSMPYLASCIVVASGVIFLGLEWDLRRKARLVPKQEFEFELTDEWMEIRSASAKARNSWDTLRKVKLTKVGVVFYWGDQPSFFVPSRAFISYYPRDELKGFLQRKLKPA